MKKTIQHLPKSKQDELKRIVSVIQEHCDDVGMIVLFGSYARGDWREEEEYVAPNIKSGHKSDYDVLVVVGKKNTARDSGIWHRINENFAPLNLSTHVRIITIDIKSLNVQLSQGQYFYSDIIEEGCLLYDSSKFKLASKRKLKPSEIKCIAQDHFDSWFDNAMKYHKGYQFYYSEQDYKQAAFLLHQTAEASYKAVLLVHEDYIPKEHYLSILKATADKIDPSLAVLFPQKTREQDDRFKLLDYAYIGARYDPDFWIAKEDLQILAGQVEVLLKRTEKMCAAKIRSIAE